MLSVAFSPNKQLLAAGAMDGTVAGELNDCGAIHANLLAFLRWSRRKAADTVSAWQAGRQDDIARPHNAPVHALPLCSALLRSARVLCCAALPYPAQCGTWLLAGSCCTWAASRATTNQCEASASRQVRVDADTLYA